MSGLLLSLEVLHLGAVVLHQFVESGGEQSLHLRVLFLLFSFFLPLSSLLLFVVFPLLSVVCFLLLLFFLLLFILLLFNLFCLFLFNLLFYSLFRLLPLQVFSLCLLLLLGLSLHPLFFFELLFLFHGGLFLLEQVSSPHPLALLLLCPLALLFEVLQQSLQPLHLYYN